MLDIGRKAPRYSLLAGVASGVVGFAAVSTAVAAAERSGVIGLILTWAIGLVFLGIAVATAVNRKKISRPRRLVLEAPGVRWDDPQGIPWAVHWDELSSVAITRSSTQRPVVQLDLFPADAQFRHRHPEMEHLWQFRRLRNGYRLSLGTTKDLTSLIDTWMQHFRSRIYTGVHEDHDIRIRRLAQWGDPTGSGGWLMTPETYRRRTGAVPDASTDRGTPNRHGQVHE